jgi:hypothetical protein
MIEGLVRVWRSVLGRCLNCGSKWRAFGSTWCAECVARAINGHEIARSHAPFHQPSTCPHCLAAARAKSGLP